jgi:hypothetical protein
LALFVLFQWRRGLPAVTTAEGGLHLLAGDIGMFAAPVLLGWAIVAIPEVMARRRGRQRTAIRRNTLIAAWVLGGLMMVGMSDEESSSRTGSEGAGAEGTRSMPAPSGPVSDAPLVPREELRRPEAAPTEAIAPRVEPQRAAEQAKPTPWAEIVQEAEYVQASNAERKAIRDLYWRICIEARVPDHQRGATYQDFVRYWEITESDVPAAPSRTMSPGQYLREKEHGAPSPVSAGTMNRWCEHR